MPVINYQYAKGLQFPASALGPRLITTEDGKELANIPGWKAFIDPDYVVDNGTALRDRANKANRVKNYNMSADIPVFTDTFPNGAVGYRPLSGSAVPPYSAGFRSSYAFNPTAWSVFFVIHKNILTPSAGTEVIRYAGSTVPTGNSPRITVRSSNQLTVYASLSTDVRLDVPGVVLNNEVQAFCVSSSVAEGVRAFKNDVLIGSNLEDKRPLDVSYGSGETSLMRTPYGSVVPEGEFLRYGRLFLFDIDMGSDENAVYRQRVFAHLMRKYGITA